jgi:hypothetical protein
LASSFATPSIDRVRIQGDKIWLDYSQTFEEKKPVKVMGWSGLILHGADIVVPLVSVITALKNDHLFHLLTLHKAC